VRNPLSRVRQHPVMRRLGRALGHCGKRVLGRVLDGVISTRANQSLETLGEVRRVLLVRPNFRIGNTLITTPLVLALRERFPGSRLDYLGGDTTASLLASLPVDTVYAVSRWQIARPWEFVALFSRLRAQRYDVAVDGGMGSFSGGLYTYLAGARHRIGCTGAAERFFDVRLPRPHAERAYEMPVLFARMLGVSCPDRPVYQVGPAEQRSALSSLRGIGFADLRGALPFVALTIGGHRDKRLPLERWIEYAQAICAAGARLVVTLGPEDAHLKARIQRQLPGTAQVLLPQSLRALAALLAAACIIMTPDSGPMHLAAALGVPAIVLLQAESSRYYAPHGRDDRVLLHPTAAEVIAALTAHQRWPGR
jgi:heptosyltransferase-3